VAKEHRLEAIIGGIRVIGKIDRIDRHRDSGRLRVIDYKTSERAVTPAKAHLAGANREVPVYARIDAGGKPATWINLQLPLYRMLLEAEGHFTGPMELAYFNLPRAVRETGVSPWDTWDDALFESAVQCALGVIADVSARRFWPPAPRVQYDEFAGLFVGDPALCFVPPDAEGAP
jgi:ATP-dependent helicase/nuclease subunit B